LDQNDEILWQMIPLSCLFVLHYSFLQEGGLLVPRLQEAKQRVSQTREHYATIKIMQWLALSYSNAGQLHLVYQECLAARALLQQIEGHSILAGYFTGCLTYVFYQWNRPEEMWTLVQEQIQDARVWQHIDLLICGYLYDAMAGFAAGDLVLMKQALQKGEDLMQQERFATTYKSEFMELWVQYWLATGDLAAANEWASHVSFHEENLHLRQRRLFLMWVRVLCAQQRYAEAIEALDRFSRHFDRPGDGFSTQCYLATSVTTLRGGGERARAREALTRLLRMTEQEGHLRLYLDQGESMCQALQELFDSMQPIVVEFSPAYVLTLLTAFEQEKQRWAQRAVAPSAHPQEILPQPSPHPISLAQPVLIEALSPQERRVLRLLVAGRSYVEIAQELIVSLNTIKTQVSSIYRKLGVKRRAEASELARRLNLI
jgi:LuxR family maltose regulon positive regulatory protein